MINSKIKLETQIEDQLLASNISSPSFIISEQHIINNLKKIEKLKQLTNCQVILALKAFSNYDVFNVMKPYLDGATASSLHEAKLAREEFGGHIHTYSPGYKEQEIDEVINYSNCITFNSLTQVQRYKDKIIENHPDKSFGIRLNPEFSDVCINLYNPCQQYSRFGVTQTELNPRELDFYIKGALIHTLCGKNEDSLARTVDAIEEKFGLYLYQMEWLNLGGGHMIGRDSYNIDNLAKLINRIQNKYNLRVILEPGEGLVLNSGFYITEVLDIMKNEIPIAILDASATTHLPDVLEMPYRPEIHNAKPEGEAKYTYKLGGITCLSGDILGTYSFDSPLEVGDRLIIKDTAQYTNVKTTTFNGIQHPSITILRQDGNLETVKSFGYQDFKSRLGS
ncbi:carboxynorspermidine decarboxylase [Candidatus Marinamargulisbacteria bacterium SCGC AG-410-N11]|nr:carboxynorspermidine decarboxylase [Candidatus Marinamargulisbacteria bacterium SCGC AG-410-N11]